MTDMEIFTLVIAILGLSLGIINAAWSLIRDRARLHISVLYDPPENSKWNPQDHRLLVSIGNASLFALTIKGVYLADWFGLGRQRVNFYHHAPSEPGITNWPVQIAQGAEMELHLSRSLLNAPSLGVAPDVSWWNSSLVIETATGERFAKRGSAIRTFLKAELMK